MTFKFIHEHFTRLGHGRYELTGTDIQIVGTYREIDSAAGIYAGPWHVFVDGVPVSEHTSLSSAQSRALKEKKQW